MKEQAPLWKIVASVAAGVLVAGIFAWAVRLWLVNQAIAGITESTVQASHQIMESSNHLMQALQQEVVERQQAAAQDKLELATELAKQQHMQAQQEMAAICAETAKEEPWARNYKRPTHCDEAVGDTFVECGYHHIRAKRKFEELYAAGRL